MTATVEQFIATTHSQWATAVTATTTTTATDTTATLAAVEMVATTAVAEDTAATDIVDIELAVEVESASPTDDKRNNILYHILTEAKLASVFL